MQSHFRCIVEQINYDCQSHDQVCKDQSRIATEEYNPQTRYYQWVTFVFAIQVIKINTIQQYDNLMNRLNSVKNTNFGLDNKKSFLTHSKIVFGVTDNICIK